MADEIERQGARALRINLCAGDALYWRGRSATSYRGGLSDWHAFLTGYVIQKGVTDIVYFADRLPYHRVAIDVAERQGIRATTFEFGYLRPDWITLERRGMSAQSHFPRDPDAIRAIAAIVPAPDLSEEYPYGFLAEAFHEVVFNLSTYLLWPLYPRYEADRYYNPIIDYLGYIPRLIAGSARAQRARALTAKLVAGGTSYFLVPLQMQSDYQLRANSPYLHQRDMIGEVVRSFACDADPDTHLVFKLHPLDNGLESWPRIVERAACAAGLQRRVHTVDGGNLGEMVRRARGVVAINSTVGLLALRLGIPLKVLGIAVFDVDGLCHRGPLATFWRQPMLPDAALVLALVRALAGTIQIKGNFFTREGRRAAVPPVARRLLEARVNQPNAFIDPPPRLTCAQILDPPRFGK